MKSDTPALIPKPSWKRNQSQHLINSTAIAFLALFFAAHPTLAQTITSGNGTQATNPSATSPSAGTITKDAKGNVIAYTASTGKTYKLGDTVRLGLPTRMDKKFANIKTSFKMKHWEEGDLLHGDHTGEAFIIKGMDAGGGLLAGRSGPPIMYFYFKIKGIMGGLYEIDVEPALAGRELQ